jgi:hypothetical protein
VVKLSDGAGRVFGSEVLFPRNAGGVVATAKSRFIAEESIRRFVRVHRDVYYFTFTFRELIEDKAEAERRFKPFIDLVRRRGGEHLECWELQKRGAWHVHGFTNLFFDVTWLRPWMVARGWGPQMKLLYLPHRKSFDPVSGLWVQDDRATMGLVKYLLKYLTKSFKDCRAHARKKAFGSNATSRAGTTAFKWVPWENPGAYLYAIGLSLWFQLGWGIPQWRDYSTVMRLGFEDAGWAEVDPFYVPP